MVQDQGRGQSCRGRKTQRGKTPQTPTGTGFREVAYEYLDFCKRKYSEKNYKEKVFIYKTFLVHLGADREIGGITARDITGYLGTRPGNANWNKHRKSLCAFFQWAFKHNLVSVNPCIHVESMPEDPKRKAIPSQEEMVKILLASGEYRPYFLALYALAARRGEINNLRWEDVSFEKRQVVLWTKKGRTGEMRPQKKPMNPELYEVLRGLYDKRSTGWVFPNPETGEPYRNRRAQIRCRPVSMRECPIIPGTLSATMWPLSWPITSNRVCPRCRRCWGTLRYRPQAGIFNRWGRTL